MIRSGYLALRSIADFYRVGPEAAGIDELSVTRNDFERLLDDLAASGVGVAADRSQAWVAFAGWRLNYDRAIGGLRDLVGDLPSHWHVTEQSAADRR